MRRISAKILNPAMQFFVKHYFKKPRRFRYKSIDAIVNPGVFFPHFTISTKFFIDFLENEALNSKSVLELGCGTGIISAFAAKRGADVTATDINPAAVENATINAKRHGVEITALTSDLFSGISPQQFDSIVINPPYYPKQPQNMAEQAWFCGEDFQYFKRLFDEMTAFVHANSLVYMVLSEDCDFEKIKAIAAKHQWQFDTVAQKRKYGEMSFIFRVSKS